MDKKVLDVFIPTWEVFKNDICPADLNPTKSDWIATMTPKSIYTKLSYTYLNEVDPEEGETVDMRVVMVDDKCIEWIKKYNRKIDYDSFERYSSMLSDEECLKMLKDNNMFNPYSLNFVSLTLTLEFDVGLSVYNQFLPKDIRDELQSYLETVFGNGNVWLSDRILGINSAYKMISDLYEELKTEMENKQLTDKSNEEQVKATKATYVELFIPFLLKDEVEEEKCTFKVGDCLFYDDEGKLITKRAPEVLILDKGNLKSQGLRQVKPFQKSKAYKMMLKYFGKDTIINHLFFVSDYDLNDYYKEKQDALRKYAELAGLNFIEI